MSGAPSFRIADRPIFRATHPSITTQIESPTAIVELAIAEIMLKSQIDELE